MKTSWSLAEERKAVVRIVDCLAGGDVQADWAWVVVLEVSKRGAADGLQLVRNSCASWAGKGCDNSAGAWSDGLDPKVGLD